jgi:hypothetical protein
MQDAPLSHVSPLSSYWRCAYYRRVSHFIAKGDELLVAHLAFYCKGRRALSSAPRIDLKVRRTPYGRAPFILSHPAWYRSFVPPRLLELILTTF